MDYNNNNNQNQGQNAGFQSQQPPYGQNAAPQQPHYSSQNNFQQNTYSQQGAYSQQNAYSNPQAYQQPQFNSPYAQAPVKPGPNACQIISLICGILSIICCCTGILGIILGGVGLLLAIIGNKDNKHGVGTGGLVCSIIGLILALIILGLSLLGSYTIPRDFQDLYEQMEMYER